MRSPRSFVPTELTLVTAFKIPRLVGTAALFALLCALATIPAEAGILVTRDSPGWKYQKGATEPSNPIAAWRAQGFDDSLWSTGDSPFRYGDGNGGTVLSDMRNSYSTLYLRRTFNVSDVALVSRLTMEIDYDDGFTVWINGTEVLDENSPATREFDSFAETNHESGAFGSFDISNPAGILVEGENTIAIQVFNVNLDSSDLMMNPELISTAPDFDPPVVVDFSPGPGTVLNLAQVTVSFSEPVMGVSAEDLRINDTAASSVSGFGDQYTFTFANVPLGQATVSWAANHGIVDTATVPNAFDHTALSEVRVYNIVDNLPPSVTGIFPPAGVTLRSFGEMEITFSEPVSGVEASDLLANGIPASSVSGSGNVYTFTFTNVGTGAVSLSWAPSHGIEDRAAEPNAFEVNGWSYTVDPNAAFGNLVINEFIASNRSGRLDEDGEASDWIELFNFGNSAIALSGWSLSDDSNDPGQFVLPARTLPAGGYLVIFATGKDRAPNGFGEIHTNFKLSGSSEYLGLFAPESPRTVADEISPEFPLQRNDHSYGRDSSGAWRYYASPTPGAANGDSTIVGLLQKPHPNVGRGFFNAPFDLHLTTPDSGVTLRYTTDGSEPTSSKGKIYSVPITINRTTVFRAAAFRTGYLPSAVVTQTYMFNASAAIRSLPVISLTTEERNLWGPTGIQETNPRNCAERGIAWERPVSAEFFDANDSSRSLGVDCGLRVQGGNYIRGNYTPNGGLPFSKYSFRLYFRGDYGSATLKYPFFKGHAVQEFDRVTLRAGMNDHSDPYIVDEMIRRLQFDTGSVAARGNFVNLFINGDYKGYYNPTERIDDDFMRSWHGGDEAWDVIAQFGEVREGDTTEWNRMRSTVGRDQSVPANYAASLDVLDVDNFIDYLLVNIYGGTGDWPSNNWRAARERIPGAKFRFYVWDAEWSLGNQGRAVNVNTITGELGGGSEIATLFQSLTASPEFRIRFADRVHKHFFNGGALEDTRISAHYEGMRREMSGVLPGMSTSIRTSWIPQRRSILMRHLFDADLQHSEDAPTFAQFGGTVPDGYNLTMSAPSGGTIYYTLDGMDPRKPVASGAGDDRVEILAETAAKRVLIPSVANGGSTIGTRWTGRTEPFDDSSWTSGSGGVGYDTATTYESLIDIDVEAEMNNINTSCYIRIPFTVSASDLADANFMQLKARYDDGFVAYLNGVRIIAPNGPASPQWNSSSEGDNSDESAVNLRAFNVSNFMEELVVGNNQLAIHGLNTSITSSDFLASFTMEVGENLGGEVADNALEYTAPPAIAGTTLVRSRTLKNGVWSAMTEATFINGPSTPQLVIAEIMYHPPGGSALEFIEIQNVGPLPVDLSFVKLEGASFTFPGETAMNPGERIILASDESPVAFASVYPGVIVFGYFGGSLSNGGERVALMDQYGSTLFSVDYSDGNGWPLEADGGNRSLTLRDPNGDP
ncbi:MAG: lamin tail domain-containing protein, partial [Verrucomicrobia bacterium]|nr:lamin tail domain-containing protein [Verrucomicrobiota bacterium]